MERKEIKRGDIYLYDFGEREGSVQSGYRPILVLQGTRFNIHSPTITVAAITSAVKKKYLPTHIHLGTEFGLAVPSMVLLEQIQTVSKAQLGKYLGNLNDSKIWREINKSVRLMFGLQSSRQVSSDIRCLCSKCRQDYMENSQYIIRRVDPLAKEKDHCDKCDGWGYDYFIYEKKCQNSKRGCEDEKSRNQRTI